MMALRYAPVIVLTYSLPVLHLPDSGHGWILPAEIIDLPGQILLDRMPDACME